MKVFLQCSFRFVIRPCSINVICDDLKSCHMNFQSFRSFYYLVHPPVVLLSVAWKKKLDLSVSSISYRSTVRYTCVYVCVLTCYRTKLEQLLFPIAMNLQLMQFQMLLVLVAWRTVFQEHSSQTFQLMFVSFVYGPKIKNYFYITNKYLINNMMYSNCIITEYYFTCWLCLSPPVWGNWPCALSASSSHLDNNGFNLHIFLNESWNYDFYKRIYINSIIEFPKMSELSKGLSA